MPTIKIDHAVISVAEGTTILQAAEQAGIYIPHLCFHPDLSPVSRQKPAQVVYRDGVRIKNMRLDLYYEGCRLCVVEIAGQHGLYRSCSIPVADGMIISTFSPVITDFRRERIMELVTSHPHVCLTCTQKAGCAQSPCSLNIPESERCCTRFEDCEFRQIVEYVGLSPETPRYIFADLTIIRDNPILEINFNLCIGCLRCIRVCRDLYENAAIDFVIDDSGRITVGTTNKTLKESSCTFCMSCIEICPTGALIEKEPRRLHRRIFNKPALAPSQAQLIEYAKESLASVSEESGVYQFLDEQKKVIYIKGVLNLRKELEKQLQINKQARYFIYEEHPLYSMRESELLQQYLANHGEMPALNLELDGLF
jgi:NADH dehydrogenase/NADH:ubiquinone oxidoreductase subunit G